MFNDSDVNHGEDSAGGHDGNHRKRIRFYVGDEETVAFSEHDVASLTVQEVLDISGNQPASDFFLIEAGHAAGERKFEDLTQTIHVHPGERFIAQKRVRFFVDTEGTIHPWPTDHISTEQIAALGGWDVKQGVIEIDGDNTERTLKPGEIIQLRPGHAFAKKVRWKRG